MLISTPAQFWTTVQCILFYNPPPLPHFTFPLQTNHPQYSDRRSDSGGSGAMSAGSLDQGW